MRNNEQTIFDSWTQLSFKRQFGSRRRTSAVSTGFRPPDWIGPEHARRMQAYGILKSYEDNAAREFMNTDDREKIDDRREYGDAALLISTVVSALLGEDQQIVTEGAEELALEEDAESEGTPDPDAAATRADAEAAMALQDWLREWATQERLGLKMLETERLAVGLGDGVYTLGWSADKGRPRVRVWDPMFYFPVLDDGNEDDYPRKVHIAWEVMDENLRGTQMKIRRLTWELGPIAPVTEPNLAARLLRREFDLFDGDEMGGDGRITRVYPWSEEPSGVTCYFTDATWTLDAAAKSVNDLTGGTAEYEVDADGPVNHRDLFIDFLPVVHMPNTVSLLNHFGRSLLSSVAQILDDLSAADTDLAASSATTGHPVIALQSGTVDKDSTGRARLTYEPGEILESGEGKLEMLDTSRALQALIGYIEFLMKRLSTNSRVAEALLGRIKPSEVPSGIALQLGFGPTDQLVREMRLVRAEKYPLLLKFAHRLALAGGMDDVPPEWIHSEVVMGSFLPQDLAAAVDQVTRLYAGKVISLETCITMLVEAGLPIASVLEEVRRIQERDFASAAELFDATGDKDLVYAFLGKEPPEEEEPEEVQVVPGQVPIPTDPGADPTLFGSDGQPLQ